MLAYKRYKNNSPPQLRELPQATSTWCHGNKAFIHNAAQWMARTRASGTGKLALMARSGGQEGAGQQTEGELVGTTDMWVGL